MTYSFNTSFRLAAAILTLTLPLTLFGQDTRTAANSNFTNQTSMKADLLPQFTKRQVALNSASFKLEPAKSKESFDMTLFGKLLEQSLAGKSVGLAYAVSTEGGVKTLGGLGYFRTAADGAPQKASAFAPLYIASMNKTITATALIKCLGDKGISVDQPIEAWLPKDWKRGPGIDKITFRQLLTHQTRFSPKTWWEYYPDLKAVVAAGATDPTMVYRNTNFNLMRILIATLNGFVPGADEQKNGEETARIYREYVQKTVFSKCLIANAPYKADPADSPVLNYPNPDQGKKGYLSSDLTLNCGAQGIQLSAMQYSTFLRTLLKSETILTAQQRQLMLDGQLGLFAADTPRGKVYQHGGYMPEAGNGGGFSGAWYVFPGDIRVVVLCNSEFAGDMTGIVTNCYNQSWKTTL